MYMFLLAFIEKSMVVGILLRYTNGTGTVYNELIVNIFFIIMKYIS